MSRILSTIIVLKDYISDHPQIGAASGLGSGIFLILSSFFTDESVLRYAGICGVWLGLLIAIMTAVIKLFDLAKIVVKFFKKQTHEKNR